MITTVTEASARNLGKTLPVYDELTFENLNLLHRHSGDYPGVEFI